MTAQGRCKHGMRDDFCGACRPQAPATTSPAAARDRHPVVQPQVLTGPMVVLHVQDRGRLEAELRLLDDHTRGVHLLGYPHLWLLKEILRRAPALEFVQAIPTMVKEAGATHRALLEARHAQLRPGHIRPDRAWTVIEPRNEAWRTVRHFLLSLSPERKLLWDELIGFGFEAATIAARYYCLRDEEYRPLHEIADDFGVSHASHVLSVIQTVLFYLDPGQRAELAAKRRANALRSRVLRLRQQIASEESIRAARESVGAPWPEGMPWAELETYSAIVVADRAGALEGLHTADPKAARVLRLRFGLGENPPRYRKLHEIGTILDGVTREWARQLEARALAHLGIEQ